MFCVTLILFSFIHKKQVRNRGQSHLAPLSDSLTLSFSLSSSLSLSHCHCNFTETYFIEALKSHRRASRKERLLRSAPLSLRFTARVHESLVPGCNFPQIANSHVPRVITLSARHLSAKRRRKRGKEESLLPHERGDEKADSDTNLFKKERE